MVTRVFLASGVSDSSCTNPEAFAREERLLTETLSANQHNPFVYFSSCALSAPDYAKNAYYQHKQNMENIIRLASNNHYIFRIPQLFGDLILHKTLINFIYKCIEHKHSFHVYNGAYRYVIDIQDVLTLVEAYLKHSKSCVTVDIANTHRYSVIEIVRTFEVLLKKKASYTVVDKFDQYFLDLRDMVFFMEKHNINLKFGESYIFERLKIKIENFL